MFLLGIGLGRSKRLILNHIFRGITALILTSAIAHADDGEDLLKAASAGDLAQVRALLEKGTDIDHQRRDGGTALIFSSQNGHEEIVQALLARGAEIDHQTKIGRTALIQASQQGHEGVVQALLARGANVELRENGGGTALLIASQNGDQPPNQRWCDSLYIASQNGHEGIVQPCWPDAYGASGRCESRLTTKLRMA